MSSIGPFSCDGLLHKRKHHMTLSILSLSGSAWTGPWDDSVSNDLGRIRHAWSATRVQTASCCPCAHDQLSTRSVWFFPSRISAGWLCPLPHVRHPFGAMRSCLDRLQENKGIRVLASLLSPATEPAKNSAPRSRYILRLFSSVARRSTARPGHFTSFPSLPIQSLFR